MPGSGRRSPRGRGAARGVERHRTAAGRRHQRVGGPPSQVESPVALDAAPLDGRASTSGSPPAMPPSPGRRGRRRSGVRPTTPGATGRGSDLRAGCVQARRAAGSRGRRCPAGPAAGGRSRSGLGVARRPRTAHRPRLLGHLQPIERHRDGAGGAITARLRGWPAGATGARRPVNDDRDDRAVVGPSHHDEHVRQRPSRVIHGAWPSIRQPPPDARAPEPRAGLAAAGTRTRCRPSVDPSHSRGSHVARGTVAPASRRTAPWCWAQTNAVAPQPPAIASSTGRAPTWSAPSPPGPRPGLAARTGRHRASASRFRRAPSALIGVLCRREQDVVGQRASPIGCGGRGRGSRVRDGRTVSDRRRRPRRRSSPGWR